MDIERDEETGLEFWKVQDPADVESPIWSLWQQGTRYHWAWPCPHCREWFIPRFTCLVWPKGASPAEAKEGAHVACPRCGGCIGNEHKAEMNRRGVFVAEGQRIAEDGTVTGDPPASDICSFWVSGLASPFRSFGDRAQEFVEATRSGDPEKIRVVVNAGFGELWAPSGGDAPEWKEVAALRLPYRLRELPEPVVLLTAGVDVQKDRLPFVIRGWAPRQESWLIDHGELFGDTADDRVWLDLAELLETPIEGMAIRRAFVDSGFRPGKRDAGDEHRVYEFVRRHARIAYATKGYASRQSPLSTHRIEVSAKGGKAKWGLDLVRLDSDFFKSWVHQRIRWPLDQPGGWHLAQDATDEYCRQVVSEARVRSVAGRVQWIRRTPENHMLDCEALAYAAAWMLGVQRMPDTARRAEPRIVQPPEAKAQGSDPFAPSAPRPRPGGDWVGAGDNWV